MINLKTLNDNQVVDNLKRRGYHLTNEWFILMDEQKILNVQIEAIQHKVNQNIHVPDDKKHLKTLKEQRMQLNDKINAITHMIPNIIHETVPNGKGENDNVVLKTFFDDTCIKHTINHAALGAPLGLDIQTGVDLAHTRFNVMRGEVAKLHRKLVNMALDFYDGCGYEEFYVPNLVNEDTMFGTGQFPKFKEELFTTMGNQLLYLIPTGEVPLTNVVKNKVLLEADVEQKFMTHTPCFRKEVGTYGKDTKGIIRQHQFEKVELVRTCLPENGLQNFEALVNDITLFVQRFNIPFRIIELCAGDIGFAGHKAYDFEIWFPCEQRYREIATVTWCHDFQARRMNARYKNGKNEKAFIHTLNGTGLAVGRVLAAILENYKDIPLQDLLF